MVVEKQCGYKTFIAPELMINNIAVFAVRADVRDLQLLHGRLHHRHGSCVVFCEDLTAEERLLHLL